VTFSTPEQAAEAIRLFNQREVGGRRLNVNQAEDRPRRSNGEGRRPEGGRRFDAGPAGGPPPGFGDDGERRRDRSHPRDRADYADEVDTGFDEGFVAEGGGGYDAAPSNDRGRNFGPDRPSSKGRSNKGGSRRGLRARKRSLW
jgi:RNA recognition motif-containing protein